MHFAGSQEKYVFVLSFYFTKYNFQYFFIEICVIFIEIRVNDNIIKSQFEETICGK